MLSNSRRFTFLLGLLFVATGCRGLGSVIDNVPIPRVGSVIDEFPIPPVGSVMDDIAVAAKANRVAGVLDGGILIADQSPVNGSDAVSKSRIKAMILDFSCDVMVDALQDGSVTWEDAKNEAASALISSFSDGLGIGEEADAIVLLWDTMDALENESDSNVYMASQICSRLE